MSLRHRQMPWHFPGGTALDDGRRVPSEARDANSISHGIQLAVAPVFLLSAVAALIGATIMSLFPGETLAPHSERLVPWSFLGGITCFVLALLAFSSRPCWPRTR